MQSHFVEDSGPPACDDVSIGFFYDPSKERSALFFGMHLRSHSVPHIGKCDTKILGTTVPTGSTGSNSAAQVYSMRI